MANLVAMNIKRKDVEVASHGFATFLDPKRIKLQDASVIPEMMEEEKPLADADSDAGAPPAGMHPTMIMPLLSPPTQGQEANAHGITVSTESGSKSSEAPSTADQAAPMDIEDDVRQPQPGQHPQFWSGFF
ncbi:hypothetical protein SEVIR_6G020400v4 [Setaria viridis]|uniref:Uncharacterized protein n=1 Tax=Setaria viridis TaxID=4556 RepID=A0A4U6UD29_SETVI|nr:uncharacterized protein LOC117860267 [Setaria viridis]TKW08297.1 hypothetical protein SEVIR_6G020400v2 [Setaria viridis]